MVLIVLASSPFESTFYQQGIEAALNIADAREGSVSVLLSGDFLKSLNTLTLKQDHVKKLGQFELFEVPVFAPAETPLDFVKKVSERELVETAEKVVTF